MNQTLYNGSLICACGRAITPYEALWGHTCQRCRARKVAELVKNRMVESNDA